MSSLKNVLEAYGVRYQVVNQVTSPWRRSHLAMPLDDLDVLQLVVAGGDLVLGLANVRHLCE